MDHTPHSDDECLGRLRARLQRIGFGGDYNPEQWPEEVREEDMRLMRQAAVSLATVGVFTWAQVEPSPGAFDFDWFDRVMDDLSASGIGACLATMTASPPPWLAALHPATLPVRADGVRLSPGARQHYCPSSPVYRAYAIRLVEQIATRYAGHPALALWHIGNEYGCHVSTCYCDVSADHFRHWLYDRYGSVDALNDAWSTAFWSQRYDDWAHVLPPREAPSFANPAQQLDFARFSSDALLECYLAEKEVLTRMTPDIPVTTNFAGVAKPLDFFRWAEHQDIVSYDSYPDPHDPDSHVEAAFAYDLARSLRDGRPWLLMEQASGAVNWRDRNGPKPPGLMRLWSWQAVARGADAILYFQWRQSRGGAEKHHSAMLPHGGPNTRTFREVSALGDELTRVPQLLGGTVPADVALVMDWSNWWALELDSHPSSDVRQMDTALAHYAPLYQANITCDVVHPAGDLERYRLVVVPNLYLVDENTARNLTEYVRRGGHLLMSFFSGIADTCDRVHPGRYPAPFRELLGLHIEEFWPLRQGERIGLSFTPPLPAPRQASAAAGTLWSEVVAPDGAEVLARFTNRELAGGPAVTRHRFGEGTASYVGTRLDKDSMAALMAQVVSEAGVEPVLPGLRPGVEAVVRRAEDGDEHLLLLNHRTDTVHVNLPRPMVDLLGDATPTVQVALPTRGVSVLRRV